MIPYSFTRHQMALVSLLYCSVETKKSYNLACKGINIIKMTHKSFNHEVPHDPPKVLCWPKIRKTIHLAQIKFFLKSTYKRLTITGLISMIFGRARKPLI